MDTEPRLQVRNLCCIRQQRPLFANLCFQVQAGEALLIEGPNGSGKSSLLRLLTGLATPSSGEILWQGGDIQHAREEYWKHIHYIGHANGIKLGLTVIENLQLAQSLSLEPASATPEDVLHSWNLQACQAMPAKNLSAGQKRRLALARLLMLPKPLWILDEPVTALDADTQVLFLSHLEAHLQKRGMAIISSHHLLPLQSGTTATLRLPSC
ncbi:Cytochrome c biogenesis ATP-binding export protein CcmA [Aquicella siphonis]|uniref:Cytochrome c biogenesis ATP-binding export protein CcmA n=1 Tax=Aquicella siphonis TaxID=254247 RepID=A0A5E4PIZ9_9COXI|nr:cytochrome c biogenesis heme-transporting ATPase CcmA [Aquicella siphonis]VVC76934.1 Cytochrome c biogenesis ATP-binding export protein CcmA [Aquicella siphonis]